MLIDSKHLLAMGGLASVMLLMSSAAVAGSKPQPISVSGSGVDLASDAIVHSEQNAPTGLVKRLTEMVRLEGDLNGYVLYQATQQFDDVNKRLIVTGENVFSGTIRGSEPLILRSDESRFEVNLVTGEETGNVHLTRSNDAPDKGSWYECALDVVGTGVTPEGNPTFDYSGECTRRGA